MTSKPLVGAMLLLAMVGPPVCAEEAPAAGGKPSCCRGATADDATAALDAKVGAMNAAQGAAKVDAIAAVVTELVTQHRTMHQEQGCCGGACPMMQGHQGHGGPAGAAGGAAP